MVRKMLILCLVFFIAGCAYNRVRYDIRLSEVEGPRDAKNPHGEKKIVKFNEEGATKYRFEDEAILVEWAHTNKSFVFRLKNKTENSIKLIWNEAVYVDSNGMSHRVMHQGVKYIERNNPQPPTVVVRGASVLDSVTPTDNVYYISGRYGGWRTKDLFQTLELVNDTRPLEDIASGYVGKEVQIMLPVQIENVTNEYVYQFTIHGYEIKKEQPNM